MPLNKHSYKTARNGTQAIPCDADRIFFVCIVNIPYPEKRVYRAEEGVSGINFPSFGLNTKKYKKFDLLLWDIVV